MSTLYTIGFQRKSLAVLIGALREHNVDAVIDIRLRNTSQLAGYTKRDDLAFLLREGFAIAYEHRPELAPTDEILDAYHKESDWPGYERALRDLLVTRRSEQVGEEILARYRAPCLLCAEPTAQHCHRRLVAEHWAAHLPELTIVHL